MNTDLLFQLYAIHSPSGSEKKMRRFIRKYITEHCGEVSMETDKYGNLLCVKGDSKTYPCLASHMDQVQKAHSKDFEVITNGDVCFGYSKKSHEQQGLGADDKNGIFICLECLRMFDVLKVAFFVGEETGCVGSSDVDLAFFKDCRFIIEPDRRGNSDLITSMFCGDVCSKDFIKAIGADAFGYDEDRGSITDVGELVERGVGISCLNLSCGYYEAHTDNEFTVLSELENCLDFVKHMIIVCEEVYPFEACYGGWYGKYSYYGKNTRHWYGQYDGKSSLSSTKSTTEDTGWYNDDPEYYFNSGAYDQDYQTMYEYLKIDPNLSFEDIIRDYFEDFEAFWYLDDISARAQLSDIYYCAVDDVKYEHDEFWGEEDEIVFPQTKKVS